MSEENVVENNNEVKRKNRKRKKTFLQNARKYAKKETYGRGAELSRDQYEYFVNILSVWQKGFENDEDRDIFVNNVFEQTENEEVNYSRNQIGCRVIDTFLPFANNEILTRFYKAFDSDLRPLLSDRFASHVIEMLLKMAAYKTITSDSVDFKDVSKAFALKISKFLLNNLEDYVWDMYANHTIRMVLKSFSGIFEDPDNKKVVSHLKDIEEPYEEFTEIVKEYVKRLMAWPQFKDLAYDGITSGLLQTIITVLSKIRPKLLNKMLKQLLENSFLGDEYKIKLGETEENRSPQVIIPDVFKSEFSVPVLEVALTHATPKMYTQIYAKCFVGNIVELIKDKYSNHAVQKLINNCREKIEFEAIFDEIGPELKNIDIFNRSGVLVSLSQTCKLLSTRQAHFLQQLFTALQCAEPAEKQLQIVPCLLKLVPLERYETDKRLPIALHGTIIVQTLLEFNKPIKIINSLLNMELEELKVLFSDPKGCHIMDSYMKSPFVGEKSREKMIWKLKGVYGDLAPLKYGSRSFDAIWAVTNLKHKTFIMEELSRLDGKLSTPCGRIVASKVLLDLFKRNRENWKDSLNRAQTTKELFSDIIDTK